MHRYLILAQSKATAIALQTWRTLLSGETVISHDPEAAPIIVELSSFDQDRGIDTYRAVAESICAASRLNEDSGTSGSVVVLVDNVRPARFSAVTEGITWDHLVAMLILTFPDVHWAFSVFQGDAREWERKGPAGGWQRFPKDAHDLLSLLTKPVSASLFDPTGLREWIRSTTNEALAGMAFKGMEKEYQLPERQELAAVIDEETEFAFLHAYTAYRYGFRAEVITSWGVMQSRFGKTELENDSHRYSLLLEDMRIGFHDKPASVHLSHLKDRAQSCLLLDKDRDRSKWRFLITTGQMGSDKDLVNENADYLEQKVEGRGGVLYKPLGGIIDLWEKMGLYDELSEGGRAGNAPSFVWPPTFDEDRDYEGHGSPGKLALIATTLLWRANAIKKNASSTEELIRGAVLALEAAELLGGKTPSSTLAAITLRNELEVRAECAFIGAGYHFSLEKRFQELNDEVLSITRWYHEKVRGRSVLAAKVSILNTLVLVFNEAGRMEEELRCLTALRRSNRKLSAPRSLNPVAWLMHGLLSYGEWLLASFPRLILLTLLWITIFSIVGWLSSTSFKSPIDAATNVILWFGGEPSDAKEESGIQVLSWLVVMTGVFHIGVLISYIYSLISRK
jgi:hypothetical protein